jgi:tetratricopeptide (TPR) repeat protein
VGYDEIRRIIREEEPPRPSMRVSTLGRAAVTVSTRRQSDPKRLSRLFRGELDWIVMKTLEKDRDRRYETACALAADVQRYLADEPVLASPPSLRYRLGKFLRKQRGPVLAAGVILVLLVGGIIGTSLGFVRAERLRQTAEENEQTAQKEKSNALAAAEAQRLAQQKEAVERTKAEAAKRQAMETLQTTSDEVIEQLIGARPTLGPAEKAFLENTLKRWQTFAAEKGDSELARHVRAEGVLRIATLRARLGDHDAALAGYREASVLWGELAAAFPDVSWYRQALARSHNNRGTLLRELGKLAEAEDGYRQALGIQEKLAAEVPDAPQYRNDLARSHENLGILLRELGKRAEAEDAYRQALSIQEKLAADVPAMPQYRWELARSHNSLGILLVDLGKPDEAEDAYRQARGILEKLVADFPAMPRYRQDLAASHSNRGNLLAALRKWPEAEAAYRQALGIQEKLAADFPAMAQYRRDLARSHSSRGVVLRELRKWPEAEDASRQALSIQVKLVADFPTLPQYRQDLAYSHNNRGNLLMVLHRWPEAEGAYRQALAILEKLVADCPTSPQYRQDLARSHNNRGNLFAVLSKWPETEDDYRQALAILEKLAADFPAIPQYRIDLSASQVNFGRQLTKQRQPEPALEWYARGIATLEGVLRQVKTDATARHHLRNAHGVRAETLDIYLKRHSEAVADWDRVVELSPEAEKPDFRLRRAACLVWAGQVNAAAKEAEEVAKNANAVTVFKAACVFALAAARPDETGSSLSKEACAKRTVALLRQAVAMDGKIAEYIKRDSNLRPLRQRDDFKLLIAELEKKSP